LTVAASEDEASDTVFDPEALLDRPVSDPLISGNHDQLERSYDREPFVVEGAPRDLG
jgi:hypothetical protein